MKKKILIFVILFFSIIIIYAKIKIKDYNDFLILPFEIDEKENTSEKNVKESFSLKIGNIDGQINIIGELDIKFGYGLGFTLYPEIAWLLTLSNFKDGLIFEQRRLFSLDWITTSGIFLHLFFNDDLNASEFTFKYEPNKYFNSLYITNKFNGLQINPYRELTGGNVNDINFGFDWQTKFYKGRFDIQFDSTRMVMETFRGNKRFIENKIFSSQYVRGLYYYLPDNNILEIEVYLSVEKNEKKGDEILISNLEYKRLIYGKDYLVDSINGTIKFKDSVYKKQLLVYYKTKIGFSIYEVGDTTAGIKGIYGEYDFNSNLYPQYFIIDNNKKYLILSPKNSFSFFEEKNSYKIVEPLSNISALFLEIFDNNSSKISDYNYSYDEFTGCIRIFFNSKKGDKKNIYPFIDYVNENEFYTIFSSPYISLSKNIISYSLYMKSEAFKLSNIPVNSSIIVYLNSIQLSNFDYLYDYTTNKIILNREIMDSDIIEIRYFIGEEESFNFTATLKNDFRLNKYLLIGDSYWYKMPIKLWEDSYYTNLHSMEFLYSLFLKGDFKQFLLNNKNGKLEFNTTSTLSLFLPELKGLTIIEDFEKETKGYSLSLDYKKWYPISLPTIYSELTLANFGKLFYRNTHKSLIKSNSSYISIFSNDLPEKEDFIDGSNIGPYSSLDGYNNEKNSLSLIAEFDLKADEYISFALPIKEMDTDIDFSNFKEFSIALKTIDTNGNVKIYVDAGLIGEIFNPYLTNVQKEGFDEGIKYLIGSNYLYKSKNDGINVSNDFDEDGQLSYDSTPDITRFIDSDTLNPFVDIFPNFKKVVNFKIENPELLKKIKGVRITIYSKTGANGKILFNQFRFIESGWSYDRTKSSYGIEIFPAEDEFLKNNIFSINNSEFDKKLHFQRFRERTLKINLKKNERFSISKDFITPININRFKKIGFFLLLKQNSKRVLQFKLKDSEGNNIYKKLDLSNLSYGKWHQIEFDISSFDGYSNGYINNIEFDFQNELSDIEDKILFIDEIYLQDPQLPVGFSTKNEFIYHDPQVDLKYKNFSIFKNPYIKIAINFNTINFTLYPFSPLNNFSLNNEITLRFNFIGFNFNFFEDHAFLLNYNFFILSKQKSITNISRNFTKENPLLFTFFYEFQKLEYEKDIIMNKFNLNRRIFLEVGTKFDYFYWKLKFDSISKKRESSNNSTTMEYEHKLNFEESDHKLVYTVISEKKENYLTGLFSFDNFAMIFNEDLKLFFEDSINKSQNLRIYLSFNIIPDLKYSNETSLFNNGYITSINKAGFKTIFKNNNTFDLKINYYEKKETFFTLWYKRDIGFYYENSYMVIDWLSYFKEFGISLNAIFPIIFYPPFSSLLSSTFAIENFKSLNFDELKDEIGFELDWSIFLKDYLFLPYKFKMKIIEKDTNILSYFSIYDLTFILYGKGETFNIYFKNISLEYSIQENIKIENNRDFITGISFLLIFLFYNELKIDNEITYHMDYNEFYPKREIKNSFSFKNTIYKNFFKYDPQINDKKGIDLLIKIEINSYFYTRLDKVTENNDIPFTIILEPKVGYRFNKYITLSVNLKLGYEMETSQNKNFITNRFGMEFFINCILKF